MNGINRGLFALAAAAAVGALLWTTSFFDSGDPDEFWAVMGLIAGAGIAFEVLLTIGTVNGRGRAWLHAGSFLIGFVPAAIVGAWVLLATQPAGGWQQERLASWSDDIGVGGFVTDIGLFSGVIAFGLGVLLAWSIKGVGESGTVVVDDDIAVTETRVPYERDRVRVS
jgi:hypothetical protein